MIKRLIALRLRAVFSTVTRRRGRDGRQAQGGTGRLVACALLYAFLILMLLYVSVVMAASMALVMLPHGADTLYFGIFLAATFFILFFLSIFETKSELYEARDNELLLSMPIRSRDIVIARISVVLLYNYAAAAILLLPAVAVYLILGGAWQALPGGLLLFLAVPLLATAMASGVGYLVALLSRRMRRKNLATLALSLIFFGAYMWFYFAVLGNMDQLLEGLEGQLESLSGRLSLLCYLGGAALLRPLPLLVTVGWSLLIGGGLWWLVSAHYIQIITASHGSVRRGYRARQLRGTSAYVALVRKELHRFVSSAVYMMNAGLGLLFGPALGILALVRRDVLTDLAATEGVPAGLLGVGAVVVPLLVVLPMLMISASSISLEGKSFWLLRTLPLNTRTVLLAKLTPQLLLGTVSLVVTGVLLSVAMSLSPLWVLLALLLPVLANGGTAAMGLLFNLLFPKLTWQNEAEPVKQSMPVFLVMMLSFLLGGVMAGVGIASLLLLPGWAAPLLLLLITLLYTGGMLWLLLYVGARRYESIEV